LDGVVTDYQTWKQKPAQRKAALRRNLARMARDIKTPEQFSRILSGIPDPQKRKQFYACVRPFLRFTPSLEDSL